MSNFNLNSDASAEGELDLGIRAVSSGRKRIVFSTGSASAAQRIVFSTGSASAAQRIVFSTGSAGVRKERLALAA